MEGASNKRSFSALDDTEPCNQATVFDLAVDDAFLCVQGRCGLDLGRAEANSHLFPLRADLYDYLVMCKSAYDSVFETPSPVSKDALAYRVRHVSSPFPTLKMHRTRVFKDIGINAPVASLAATIRTGQGGMWQRLVQFGKSLHPNPAYKMFPVVARMICFYIRHTRKLSDVAAESVNLTACWISGDSIDLRYDRAEKGFYFCWSSF